MRKNGIRNIPVCITFPPELLDFYDQLADHEKVHRNTLVIDLLKQFKNVFEQDTIEEKQ